MSTIETKPKCNVKMVEYGYVNLNSRVNMISQIRIVYIKVKGDIGKLYIIYQITNTCSHKCIQNP